MSKNNKKPNLTSSLLIVCALRPEAKPFIREYGLKQVISEHGFHLLSNEESGISLLIAGPGKVKMAAGFLVNKVVDRATEERFYPMIAFKSTLDRTELITVDQPSGNYEQGVGYDMEATSFLQIARLFVSVEMAQVYKVVSDNPSSNFEQITADLVGNLLTQHVKPVTELIQQIKESHLNLTNDEEEQVSSIIGSMQKQWHITANQLIQLEQSLKAQHVLKKHTKDPEPEWNAFENVKAYLYAIKQWSQTVSPCIKPQVKPSNTKV